MSQLDGRPDPRGLSFSKTALYGRQGPRAGGRAIQFQERGSTCMWAHYKRSRWHLPRAQKQTSCSVEKRREWMSCIVTS